jgi:hypothetical protein
MLHIEQGPQKCRLPASPQLGDVVHLYSAGLLSAKLRYRSDLQDTLDYVGFNVNREAFKEIQSAFRRPSSAKHVLDY